MASRRDVDVRANPQRTTILMASVEFAGARYHGLKDNDGAIN